MTEPRSTSTAAPSSPHGDPWGQPKPIAIPNPTYFPAAMAFGITLFFWGFVTSPVILGFGLLVIVVSLAGWIGEWRHEP